jgi:hypothetical protein
MAASGNGNQNGSSTAAWANADLSAVDKERFLNELKHLYKRKVRT